VGAIALPQTPSRYRGREGKGRRRKGRGRGEEGKGREGRERGKKGGREGVLEPPQKVWLRAWTIGTCCTLLYTMYWWHHLRK